MIRFFAWLVFIVAILALAATFVSIGYLFEWHATTLAIVYGVPTLVFGAIRSVLWAVKTLTERE